MIGVREDPVFELDARSPFHDTSGDAPIIVGAYAVGHVGQLGAHGLAPCNNARETTERRDVIWWTQPYPAQWQRTW